MTGVDWLIVVCIVLSVLLGLLRGLVREVVALLGWVIAVALALRYSSELGALLPLSVQWPALRTGLAGVAIVVSVLLISGVVGWLLKKMMAAVQLSWMDRSLGAGFGLMRAGVVLMAGVLFSYNTALAQQPWWQSSKLLPQAEVGARWMAPHLAPYLDRAGTKVQGLAPSGIKSHLPHSVSAAPAPSSPFATPASPGSTSSSSSR